MLTCKKFHVNMKVTMSTCKSFHANMHFFLNMHVWKKKHVGIDWHVDMQKISCQHEKISCLNMHVGKKMHVDIDWQKFHVKLELNYAVVCGEKFYSMATSLPSSVGLVSN